MRVLMVIQPVDGGAFEHVARLCRGLVANGHEVAVAGPVGHRRDYLGVEVIPLDLVRSVAPGADARALARTAAIVRRLRPEVVHAHSSKAGAVARIARPAYPRTPVVYTPHGFAFAGHFDSERERTLYRGMERALAPLGSLTLCVCEAERRLAAEVGSSSRTSVVLNGVEDHVPTPPHPALAEARLRGPVVGALAGLRPGKGIETLIDAAPRLLREHPRATLAVAGDGPGRSELERRARELGVSSSFLLLGATDGPGPLLAGCDVFVSPSWAESLPYSILEAMAAGIPIVATDVGGTGEAVADGAGMLVPARDPEPLAAALGGLLGDERRAREMGRAAVARVRERFTVDRMVDGTAREYGRLVTTMDPC